MPAIPTPGRSHIETMPAWRYDQAVAFGITHNRHRDWHDGNHPYALASWLRDYAHQVWLFTREASVDWTNNVSVISSAFSGVHDVANVAFELRRRRVI